MNISLMRYSILSFIIASIFVVTLSGCGSYGIGGPSEVEPNNTMNLADRVTGFEINGVIGMQGDEDWFVLNSQEGVNPTFIIYHDPGVDIDFEVYNTTYGVTQRVGSALGTNSGDAVRVHTPGQAHIRVWAHQGMGPYRIQIMP